VHGTNTIIQSPPVGADFHVGGGTDSHDEASHFSQFCARA